MGSELPTGKLARSLRALIAQIDDLDEFADFLERHGDVDPADASTAAGLGSLHARLERMVEDARLARELTAFYVRAGRTAA